MTEAPQSAPNAKDIKAVAAEWLMERRFSESWTAADDMRLQDWLAQSLAHRVAFVRLEAAWMRTNRLAALRPPSRNAGAPRAGRPVLVRVAASLAAFAIVGGVIGIVAMTPREEIYVTSVGGHETVQLADGSSVELNTDTRLRVDMRQRNVTLEKGEAYFQVKHDAAHPFVVSVGDHRVVDLGTKFLVRAEATQLEVALVEGKARLETTGVWVGARAAVLTPGDVAIATAASLSVKRKPEKALADALGWRNGLLVFDHATLADAVAEFNRYNRQKLVIGDAAAARLAIYGTFRADNVEDFVSLVRDVLGLRTQQRNGEIVILR